MFIITPSETATQIIHKIGHLIRFQRHYVCSLCWFGRSTWKKAINAETASMWKVSRLGCSFIVSSLLQQVSYLFCSHASSLVHVVDNFRHQYLRNGASRTFNLQPDEPLLNCGCHTFVAYYRRMFSIWVRKGWQRQTKSRFEVHGGITLSWQR